MSTPTSNSVRVTFLNKSGLGFEGSIIEGHKWGGGWGTGITLTYSFPGLPTAYHAVPYGYYPNTGGGEWGSWNFLSQTEKSGVKAALSAWSSVANITFTRTSDTSTNVGDLRFALTGNPQGTENGHAYYPSNDAWAADVWLNQASWHTSRGSAVVKGSYDYVTLIHEIGHALGLRHSFENPGPMPAQFDSYSFTIMSYSATTQNPGSLVADFFPTTPMFYDLVAIQKLYGARAHNADNTTYVYSQNSHYWQTIDDSGGIDTIKYNGANGVTIDLAVGHWSSLGLQLNFANGKFQTDTVCIGPRSKIENATGGSGADTLMGNSLANVLKGKGGGDFLQGLGGSDHLIGGGGADFLRGGAGKDVLTGSSGGDRFIFDTLAQSRPGPNHDTINDFSSADGDAIDLRGLETNLGQAFSFIGKAGFHGIAGELRFAHHLLQADTNGDGKADFEVNVAQVSVLTAFGPNPDILL